jgi:hypothetical protein
MILKVEVRGQWTKRDVVVEVSGASTGHVSSLDALPVGLIHEIAENSDAGESSARSHMLHSLQLHQSADNRDINYGSQVAHKAYS